MVEAFGASTIFKLAVFDIKIKCSFVLFFCQSTLGEHFVKEIRLTFD